MLRSVVICAAIAQLVERIHGKDEVSGSSPDRGSTLDLSAIRSPSRAAFIKLEIFLFSYVRPEFLRDRTYKMAAISASTMKIAIQYDKCRECTAFWILSSEASGRRSV